MDRRRYLALAAAGLTGLAGCSSSGNSGGTAGVGTDTTGTGTGAGDGTQTPVTVNGVELPLPRSKLNRGAAKDAIPAITEPKFAPDWSDIDISLNDGDEVVGVERDGEARAYPLRILNWHEVVNDTFDGPLLVTFCPLCGSGVTAVRQVAGETTRFGVSGLLWQSDLVMYDEATGSLWSQIFATAVRGEQTGKKLDLVPSTITTWGEWTDRHPDSRVLLPPPKSSTIVGAAARNYENSPYARYQNSDQVGIGYNDFDDDRLHPKAQVIGVADGDVARAYPLETVAEEDVVNDTVGDLPVVVTVDAGGRLAAYVRRVDGETVTFETDGEYLAAAGSRWARTDGVAVDGPHEGTQLERANDRSSMFWFAWADFYPETEVYGN